MTETMNYSSKSKAVRGAERALAAGRMPAGTPYYVEPLGTDRFVIVWRCATKIAAGAHNANVEIAAAHGKLRAVAAGPKRCPVCNGTTCECDTPIELLDGEGSNVLPLGEFLRVNEFETPDVDAIRLAIRHGKTYAGGGGASPQWSIGKPPKLAADPSRIDPPAGSGIITSDELRTDPDAAAAAYRLLSLETITTVDISAVIEQFAGAPKAGTKNRLILEAACRADGVSVPEMLAITGWKDPYWRLEPIADKCGLKVFKTKATVGEQRTTVYRVVRTDGTPLVRTIAEAYNAATSSDTPI